MQMSREDEPIPGDATEPLEEGDRLQGESDVPIKGDATEVLPLSAGSTEKSSLNLSDERPQGRRSKEK